MCRQKECDNQECKNKVSLKHLHRILRDNKKIYLCDKCYSENRLKHRQQTREDFIPTYRQRNNLPAIKETKERIKKSPRLSFYLSKDEQRVLYFKFMNQGLSPDEASKKTNDLRNFLKEKAREIKEGFEKGLITEEQANKNWREEHNKICMGL